MIVLNVHTNIRCFLLHNSNESITLVTQVSGGNIMKRKIFAYVFVGLIVLLSFFSNATAQGEVALLPADIGSSDLDLSSANTEAQLQDLETLSQGDPIAVGPQDQKTPVAAYNSIEFEYLAVWVDTGTSASLRGRLLSETGTPLGEEFIVTSGIVGTPFRF